MNNQSNNNKIYFYLKENSQKVLFTCRVTDIKKDHNDEKVMREVKFISGEGHRETKVQQESK